MSTLLSNSPIADRAARPSHTPVQLALPRGLSIRLSPITVVDAAGPAMAAGAHVPWRLRSSLVVPRASTSVGGAGGARAPRLTASSDADGRNRPA